LFLQQAAGFDILRFWFLYRANLEEFVMNDRNVICKIAQQRHRNAALWLRLWNILIWVFGAAVVVFLVIAVLFFLRQEWLPAAVTMLGTIVEGVAIKWVLDRRTDAKEEEDEAYNDVEESCGDLSNAVKLRNDLRL
jgi:hypothetical protein